MLSHRILSVVVFLFVLTGVNAKDFFPKVYLDSPEVILPFPIEEHHDPTGNSNQSFDLGNPSNVTGTIEYDPVSGRYIFKETVGENINFRNPSMMTLEEYLKYQEEKELENYWKDRIAEDNEEDQFLLPPLKIKGEAFRSIFGSDEINIRPQGSVELSFGVNSSRYDNPILPENQRKITRFDFNQRIQLNLVGQIGTKLKLTTSYNTEAAFDFENVTKLEYTGDEDQIIQKIEAGNVSMPLNTSLIQGAQALFGVKTQLRFGRLTIDAIASQSRGQKQEINVSGGAQIQKFDVRADNYEANRHFFINHYFHDHYDEAMAELPIVNTPVNITRMEVWITNRQNITENTRNIIAFADLGEAKPENFQGTPTSATTIEYPDNKANNIYDWAINNATLRGFSNAITALSNQAVTPGPFQQAFDYEKVENARRLTEQEFTYNSLLGYISLNMPLNTDEVLAVAYEYTIQGKTYQVGEFSTDGIEGQDALYLKMLKSTILSPQMKIWDLMMKNVYSIGAYQLSQADFRLDLWYNNPETSLPVNFMPYPGVDETLLVQLLEMDKLNQNNQPFPDGVFDFAALVQNQNKFTNGGTINPKNGRIYFSTVEPFGRTLYDKLVASGMAPNQAQRIAYTELYDSTLIAAQMIPSKNRFSFKGEYSSSVSSDIPLNALNVPEGAVTVTAGGMRLQEGTDFTVDYNLGRVKILNSSILESNTPIKISIESNSIFGFQQKNLMGSHFNYRVNKDFNIGATWMNAKEKPLTQKVNIGDEPYSNHMLGLNIDYRTNAPFLTRLVDLLPVISTSAPSSITFRGEGAYLIPGTPRGIGKGGISYIDDFEGSQSSIDIRTQSMWKLASVPQGQPDLFPEGDLKNDLSAGYKRSLLAWYTIDPLFYQNNALTPQHIQEDQSMLDDSRMRIVMQTELFPNLQLQQFTFNNLPVLDLAYYPTERGMYNYDTTTNVTADGMFTDPQTRWGGIMRSLSTTNFEQANIEFIQFWMLDPFNEDQEAANPGAHSGGDLYFNLGNISEDILPDSRKSFENGLPAGAGDDTNVDETVWGRVSTNQTVVNAFDNDLEARGNQDVGLDGWSNTDERNFYTGYVNWVQSNGVLSADAKAKMLADPSSDDFNYYRDDNYDSEELNILERYKRFNGHEGNSPTSEMSSALNGDGYPTQATNAPDIEDINQDNNLSESESYFQYKVNLRPSEMVVGKNYITSVTEVTAPSGKVEKWYQFRVPVNQPEKAVNGITDFRSIRFMRMFLKEWEEEVVLRFAKLELIRGEWRRFNQDLIEPGDGLQPDPDLTTFNINVVNVEEHDQREPIKYEIPPGIDREVDPGQVQLRQLNEQAMTLQVCNLMDGDARAGFRNVTFNLNNYKKLKMFVHGEETDPSLPLSDDDLTVFIRLGTDLTDNYYEYEIPLKLTPWGATSAEAIWPEENNMEIVFEDLTNLKKARNDLMNAENPTVSMNVAYSEPDPNDPTKRITVKGSPNLQDLRTIMIGVRNPRSNGDHPWKPDDGLAKCAEVWVNELRLTDFISEGGGAALASLQVQLADFANVSLSGNYSGLNWGSIDSRVQDRQRDVRMGFDMNTNMQLGQFFGKRARISMPFFFSYAVGVINPEFDPYNPDVKLSEYELNDRKERAKLGQDFTERKSYNFTNVRKERKPGKKARFWDIENASLGYGYNENLHRDFNVEYDRTKIWRGSLNYNFNASPFLWEPFKNVKAFQKSKWFALLKEAGVYLGPKSVSINNTLLRTYNERKMRNNLSSFEFDPVYIKNFTWARTYMLKYDITKNLKFDFAANNNSIFTEPDGQIDRKEDPENYQFFKDSIGRQIGNGGTTMGYNHSYNITYNIPFNKIPALDWITSNIRYSAGYDWQRAPLGQAEFGNIIQNNRNLNLTAQMNFVNLYNKVDFFKRINTGGKGGSVQPRRSTAVNRDGVSPSGGRGGAPTEASGYLGWRIKRLKSKVKKQGGKVTELEPYRDPSQALIDSVGQDEIANNQTTLGSREDKLKTLEEKLKEKEDLAAERAKSKTNPVHPVAGFAGRLLMSVRNISGTYSINDGTLLPGYNQDTRFLGFNSSFKAPTSGFVFGQQERNIWGKDNGIDIAQNASGNDWLVENSRLNTQHTTTHNQTITARATLEPIRDLRVDLTINRTYSENNSEFYRWNDSIQAFQSQSPFTTANLTYSTISIGSAFTAMTGRYQSQTFDQMREYRQEVSRVLGTENSNSSENADGYFDGYGGNQQDVIMGAFLAAYTGTGVSEKSKNPLKNFPLPNWTITYDGVSKFKFMKDIARNFVIKHSYSSTVTMGGMQTNLNFDDGGSGSPMARDLNANFISELQVQNVSISERFSPLIGFDATWLIKKNGLITKFEYKRDRSVGLSLANNQVTEVLGTEWVIGTGYKFGNVKLPWFKINNKPIISDMNFRFDLTIRDNVTVIRKIIENTNQATAGQNVISIRSSLDYNIGRNLTAQLYYDQMITNPKIATSYPTGNMNCGIRLRINLGGL